MKGNWCRFDGPVANGGKGMNGERQFWLGKGDRDRLGGFHNLGTAELRAALQMSKSSTPVSVLPVKQRTDRWSSTPERTQTNKNQNKP
jgi:hypothetical protein